MVHSRRVIVARARPRLSRSRAKHSMSGRLAWNRRRWCWWHQLAYWRKSSSYASRVRPLYPARNPASASRSVLVNTDATGMRAAEGVVVVIGHLPGRAETQEAGPAAAPATMIHLTVRPDRMTTQRHIQLPQPARHSDRKARRIAEYEFPSARSNAAASARISAGSAGMGRRPLRARDSARPTALECRPHGRQVPRRLSIVNPRSRGAAQPGCGMVAY